MNNTFIYADNAATTQLDEEAFNIMKKCLLEEYGNASEPYSFSRISKKTLTKARETIAECINSEPEEIFFTSGGTESDNWALKGVYQGDKKKIITSAIEHKAVLKSCASLISKDYEIIYLSPDKNGIINKEELKKHIDKNVLIISIMLANNETGVIEPIKELTEEARRNNILFHTDAVQALGHIPVNVKFLDVDMLSASGHKFNGPKGTGFLYVKKGTPLLPFMDGGPQESGMRAGTENAASIAAMAFALKKNCANIEKNREKLINIEKDFFSVLKENNIDYIYNGAENHITGNINISIKGISGETLLHRLDLKGICISTGSACNSSSEEISHVIRAIGVPEEYARGTIRLSFGPYNNSEDGFKTAKAIVSILKRL